jgi:hypothetical protein
MLMKLTAGVNFINVKRTKNSYERCILAAFSSYMYVEKRRSYEIFVRIILMKLTAGCLQYFYGVSSGIVNSFNFNGKPQYHLANQRQTICIRYVHATSVNLLARTRFDFGVG